MRVNVKLLLVLLAAWGLRCEGPMGPPATESLIDPKIQPKVIYTNPPSNGAGPFLDFTGQVTIRFNKIMDKSSIRRALSIASSIGKLKIDTNLVRTIGGDVFTFTPLDTIGIARWKVGQSCTITISSEAKDINGNRLSPPFSLTFLPEPKLRVLSVYPSNGVKDFPISQGPRVTFNSPVDLSIVPSMSISPATPGYWWIPSYEDSTTLYFASTEYLAFGTNYTVMVKAGAMDKFGNQLPSDYVSSFTSVDFRITSEVPRPDETVGNLGEIIYLTFSGPVDTGSVRGAFRLTPPVDGYFQLQQGSSYLEFVSSYGLLPNTRYTVNLSTLLRSSTGNPLSQPFSLSFTTDSFRVTHTSPSNEDTNITSGYIYVQFNSPINTASVDSGFAIVPKVHGVFLLNRDSYYFSAQDLQPGTKYDVTISSPTATLTGNTLLRPHRFSFTTGNL